jgi:hypothetical protein
VLLNQKIAELFKKHNVKVTVALDGVKKLMIAIEFVIIKELLKMF